MDRFAQRFPAAVEEQKAVSAAPEPTAAERASAYAEADELKAQGNRAMSAKDYAGAAKLYTRAIEMGVGAGVAGAENPNAHIYYGNRAAARLHLKEFAEAEDDCRRALALRPDYAKVHSRLGTALLSQNKLEEAAQSLRRALELAPDNASARTNLEDVERRQKLASAAGPGAAGAGAGGLPGLGGLGGLAGLMNNPAMMQQAQAMMQNPAMMEMAQNMMKDPNMMSNMMNMLGGGGGGGGPDLSQMAQMMQGLQTGRPASGAPSGAGAGVTIEADDGQEEDMYT
jgi:small glutamine-rich tetratricopeptide repeat-containing protein alpha